MNFLKKNFIVITAAMAVLGVIHGVAKLRGMDKTAKVAQAPQAVVLGALAGSTGLAMLIIGLFFITIPLMVAFPALGGIYTAIFMLSGMTFAFALAFQAPSTLISGDYNVY